MKTGILGLILISFSLLADSSPVCEKPKTTKPLSKAPVGKAPPTCSKQVQVQPPAQFNNNSQSNSQNVQVNNYIEQKQSNSDGFQLFLIAGVLPSCCSVRATGGVGLGYQFESGLILGADALVNKNGIGGLARIGFGF